MVNLSKILDLRSDSVVISALYYSARYIKQAASVRENFKDIFDDEESSAPGEEVRELVRTIIENIEEYFRKHVENLTPDELTLCMSTITSYGLMRQPSFTEEEVDSANESLRSFIEPDVKSHNI